MTTINSPSGGSRKVCQKYNGVDHAMKQLYSYTIPIIKNSDHTYII